MKGQLKAAWRFTALPILAVLTLLISGGVYLQTVASRIQKQPLTIKVKTLSSSTLAEEAVQIEEDVETVKPVALVGVAGEIQSMVDEGRSEDAVAAAEEALKADPSLVADSGFVLVHAQALGNLQRHDEAVSLLQVLSEGSPTDASVAFALGLNLSRMGDKNGAIDAYGRAVDANPLFFEAWYNAGVLHQSLGRYEQSISSFETAVPLAAGTRRAKTLTSLANVYRRSGQFNDAEVRYQQAINLYPGDIEVRLHLADLYRVDLNRSEDAFVMYEEVLLLDEGNGEAALGLSALHLHNKERIDAYRILTDTIVLNPTHENMRRAVALMYIEEERYDEALSQLNWLEENGSDAADAVFLMGRIEYAERDFAGAAETYERAFELSGNKHIESLNNLGLSLKALVRTDESKAAFEKALVLDPAYRNAHYNLGLLLLDEEDFPKARDAFIKTVEIDPQYSSGWYNLAITHGKLGAHEDAIIAYEEALRIQPANSKARLNLAVQYGKAGNRDRAIEQYRLVISLSPSNSTAWYNLAIVLKAAGNGAEAEDAYRTAISLEPGEVKYWQNLSVLLSSQKRTDEVIDLLSEAIDIHPEATGLRYNLAIQLKKLGDSDLAMRELERVVALDPTYVKAWLSIADLHSDANDHLQAAKEYEAALNLNPDDAYVRYQLGKEFYQLGQYNEAEAAFVSALESISDNAWIWYNLGKTRQQLGTDGKEEFDEALAIDLAMGRFIYRRLDRAEDSLELLEEMVREDPGNALTRIQYAEMLRRDGRLDDATAELEVATKISPTDPEVWMAVAANAIETQSFEVADNAFRTARRLAPENGDVAYEYGKFLQDDGQFAEAVPMFELAVNAYGSPYFAYRHLGEVLYELKRYKVAVEAFTNAMNLRPDSTATRYDLGKAKYRSKDYDGALVEFSAHAFERPNYYWSFIWLGRAQARLEIYDSARESYTRARELDRTAVQPMISLGDLAVTVNDVREARKQYEAVLEIDPLHESTRRKLEGLLGR